MTHLVELIPSKEALLAFEPEELGIAILRTIASGFGGNPYNGQVQNANYLGLIMNAYPPPNSEVVDAVHEAWAWLEGQALLLIDRRQIEHTDYRILSRRGRKLAATDAKRLRPSTALTRSALHRQLGDEVWELFVRDRYD